MTTSLAWLPSTKRLIPRRPCEAITIRSQSLAFVVSDDDESGNRFDRHRFALGEYVSTREQDDRLRTFRVVKVDDVVSRA